MTYELVHEFPHPLMFSRATPCLSIYLQTHIHIQDLKQDRILFRHLIKECEVSLRMNYDEETTQNSLKELISMDRDDDFWRDPTQGLAIFTDRKHCLVYKLQTPFEPLAIVSDSFHIKPLLQYFQFVQKVQILGIDAENFALYEGDRYEIKPVLLPHDAPTTLSAAIGIHLAEPYLSKGSYGVGPGMYHGQGGGKDERERSIEKFFRVIDSYVYENYSKTTKLPLILLALDQHQSVFHSISKNPYLMKIGIKADYEALDLRQMSQNVEALFQPINRQKMQDKLDRFQAALTEAKGSKQIAEITKAALNGRIETLLVEENKIIKGRINPRNEKIDFKKGDQSKLDDVLDDLAEQVLKDRGEVYLIPKTMFETKFGIGAIFRY